MFLLLLAAVLVAASIHIARVGARTPQRIGEIGLLYLLVGYCGVPMLLVSVVNLVWPDHLAAHLGLTPGGRFQEFLGIAYFSMAVLAVLPLRYRGVFLIGPAVVWTIFFAGATIVHLQDYSARGVLTHHSALLIFVTHGLISVLLAAALVSSGLLTADAGLAPDER